MKTPKYLLPIATAHDEAEGTYSLSVDGNPLFEVYYTGVIESIDDTLYITSNEDTMERVFVKAVGDDKMYAVYDGLIHGYDSMFCNEHTAAKDKVLRPLELNGFTLFSGEVTFGYSIDYDDEKDDYEVDEEDMIEVFNRKEKIPWQQVKEEGYDWITVRLQNEKGGSIFVDIELA